MAARMETRLPRLNDTDTLAGVFLVDQPKRRRTDLHKTTGTKLDLQ